MHWRLLKTQHKSNRLAHCRMSRRLRRSILITLRPGRWCGETMLARYGSVIPASSQRLCCRWGRAGLPKSIETRLDGQELLVLDSAGAVSLVSLGKKTLGQVRPLPASGLTPTVVFYSARGDEFAVWDQAHAMLETWAADDLTQPIATRQLLGVEFICKSASPGFIGVSHTSNWASGRAYSIPSYRLSRPIGTQGPVAGGRRSCFV